MIPDADCRFCYVRLKMGVFNVTTSMLNSACWELTDCFCRMLKS